MVDPFTATLGILSIGTTLFGASRQSKAARREARFRAQQNRINQVIAANLAKDAITRGERNVKNFRKQVRSVVGTQKAGFAAQGVEVDSGSAFEVQAETIAQSELEVLQIRNNARREAFGFKVDAFNQAISASNAIKGLNNQANNALIVGGVQALNTFRNTFSFGGGGGSSSAPAASSNSTASAPGILSSPGASINLPS